MSSEVYTNAQGLLKMDLDLANKDANGSMRVTENPDAGLRSQDHCIQARHWSLDPRA